MILLIQDELMTATFSATPTMSRITLALLEDSGYVIEPAHIHIHTPLSSHITPSLTVTGGMSQTTAMLSSFIGVVIKVVILLMTVVEDGLNTQKRMMMTPLHFVMSWTSDLAGRHVWGRGQELVHVC